MIRRLVILVAVLLLAGVSYTVVTFVQVVLAAGRDGARSADAIIVLGAAQYDGNPSTVLRARLDHAFDLYERDLAPLVVLTGGGQPGDRFTEASAGAAYLRAKGLPEEAIRQENQGTNSWESLAAAARFLREEGVRTVLLVSSPYHSLRVEHIAGEVGLDGTASPSANVEGFGTTLSHVFRETAAVGAGRVIGYRRMVDLDARVGGGSSP